MIKKALNSPAPHIQKIGKHSTAQTGNYLYLLLTTFLLWQLFSCLCLLKQKLTSEQTACSNSRWRRLCLPPEALCEGLWGVGLQSSKRQPCSLSGESHLPQGEGSSSWRCPPLLTVASHLCCLTDIDDCLAARYGWMRRHLLYFGVLSGKKHEASSSAHSCECLFLWWFGINSFLSKLEEYNTRDLCFPKEALISASSFTAVPMHTRSSPGCSVRLRGNLIPYQAQMIGSKSNQPLQTCLSVARKRCQTTKQNSKQR